VDFLQRRRDRSSDGSECLFDEENGQGGSDRTVDAGTQTMMMYFNI